MLKEIILAIYIILSIQAFSQQNARSDMEKHLKISFPTKRDFADKYISSVHIGFNADTIYQIIIRPVEDEDYLSREFLKNGMKQRFKYFDFGFDADRLVYNKNYGNIEIPDVPNLAILDRSGRQDLNDEYRFGSMSLFRDSTVFLFSLGELQHPMFWGQPAKFYGDLNLLEKQVSKRMKDMDNRRDLDSVIVFQCTVVAGNTPNLDKIQVDNIIYGKESSFSNALRDILIETNNRSDKPGHSIWKAATNLSARPPTTRIKIFAQLNSDGSVSLKFPNKLQNWTGD